ncbi:hypothetical protein STRATTON_32 [Erwinia phage vB_EamM_Stratton]|uniref:SH3 fold domain-containing protein n=1 Tax=Erwinia phage vB_EamM_Stratton TaxID=1883378 RepID=A0A1B2IGR0_9CAUD|nr:hypothetical protein STRATTON_32 [Erwinia phage vB_EamM_Stratton]
MFNVKSIEPGSVVNIVYDTPLKGNETRVLVLASNVGFEMAKSYLDVRAEQKNIYSSLVAQPDDDPTKYTYLLFKGADGKPNVAADAWIRNVAIIDTISVQFKVTLDNKQEIDDLKLALAARGFNDVQFEIIENVAG